MADARIQKCLRRFKELEQLRKVSIESKAVEVSEYVCPDRGRFSDSELEPDKVKNRGKKILDPTAKYGLRTAQNGMHSGLTPPSRPWVRIVYSDPDLNKYGPAKEWAELLQDKTYSVLRRSNWYSAVHSLYAEVIAYSTGCCYQGRDYRTLVRYRPMTFGEYWITQDSQGRIDTLYRKIQKTAVQLVQEFGENNVSRRVSDTAKRNTDRPFLVYHAVQPRTLRDPSKVDNRNMPWESVYFEAASRNRFLSESGYRQFPFLVCRYNTVANDVWGCEGPGFETLPDNKMLQDMVETLIIAEHKLADPPVRASSSLKGQPIRSGPGGITYYDDSNPEGLKALYEVQLKIAEAAQEAERVRKSILSGYYYDLFLMIAQEQQGNVTRELVYEKQAEKLLQLGPFIERLEDDLLDPALEFVVDTILDVGLMPPPPREIQGAGYKFEYISLLSQAQKEVGTKQIDGNLSFAMQVSQVWPDVVDVIDIDEAMRVRGDITGLPSKIVRTEDEIRKIRQTKQEQLQKEQQAQELMAAVQGAQALGKTPTDPGQPNALTDLMGAMKQ